MTAVGMLSWLATQRTIDRIVNLFTDPETLHKKVRPSCMLQHKARMHAGSACPFIPANSSNGLDMGGWVLSCILASVGDCRGVIVVCVCV